MTRPAAPAEPTIRLIRADNPSALTGSGTNSYIVGRGEVAVIDPGPDLDSHLAALLSALDAGERVARILVTHPHLDHSALAPRLAAATGAATLGFGLADEGRSAVMQGLAATGLNGIGEGLDHAFRPDVRLAEGDTVEVGDLTLTALHTPGHLGAHLCFAAGSVLFSGDHVMGWSTSIVSPPEGDMTDYMASLDRLSRQGWSRFLPGHGEAVEDPAQRLATLIRHRESRSDQILAALATAPGDAASLARRIYTDIPPALLPAASRNVLAHLIDLRGKHKVAATEAITARTIFHPL